MKQAYYSFCIFPPSSKKPRNRTVHGAFAILGQVAFLGAGLVAQIDQLGEFGHGRVI